MHLKSSQNSSLNSGKFESTYSLDTFLFVGQLRLSPFVFHAPNLKAERLQQLLFNLLLLGGDYDTVKIIFSKKCCPSCKEIGQNHHPDISPVRVTTCSHQKPFVSILMHIIIGTHDLSWGIFSFNPPKKFDKHWLRHLFEGIRNICLKSPKNGNFMHSLWFDP